MVPIILLMPLTTNRAHAVSAWNPTLLVNTESFQQIDRGDGSTTVDLQFGEATSTLKLLTNNTFQFNKSLSVLGGISGSYLTIDRQANISGSLVVRQNAAVRGNLSGSSFFGAGLGDCNNSTTSKLIYNASTGKFSCATDQTGGSSGGLGYADAQGIFVKKSGDTMTGALTIQTLLSHTTTGALNVVQQTHATGAYIKSTTHKEPALAIDIVGTPNAPHLLFGYQGVFDTNLYRAAANLLKTNDSFFAVGTISGSALRVSGAADIHGVLSASGAVHFDSNLSLNDDRTAGVDTILTFGNGTLNQDLKYINATQRFQFSKDLNVMGSISGSSLVISGASSFSGSALFQRALTTKGALSGATFFGGGLGDCNNPTTSKLIYNPSTGRFSCATDQTGGGTSGGGLSYGQAEGIFLNQGGDTMTGTLIIDIGAQGTSDSGTGLVVREKVVFQSGATLSGQLLIRTGNDPGRAPEQSLYLYAKEIADRSMLKAKGPSGIDFALQPSLFQNQVALWFPATGTTAGHIFGWTFTSAGTVSHPALASTNILTQMRRTRWASTTSSNGVGGIFNAQTNAWRGNAAGRGGFFFFARFGQAVNTNGARSFVGLSSRTAHMVAVEPSSAADSVGMGYDAVDSSAGNWKLMHNDGAGTATKIDLGSNAARNTTSVFDLFIFSRPNGSTIGVRIINISTGVVVYEGTLASDLPTSTTFLRVHAGNGPAATATQQQFELNRLYLENDI